MKPIFILIDEYDLPLRVESIISRGINRMHIDLLMKVIKANEGAVRFMYVTGILPPYKLGLFSGANLMRNLTNSPLTATLYGFTKLEIETNFKTYIEHRAEQEEKSFTNIMNFLTERYNGYCFCPDTGEKVYNPMSISSYLLTIPNEEVRESVRKDFTKVFNEYKGIILWRQW